ncbi:hypothetical protein YA0002_24565 [Pseudomonas cichorii]|uniref:hypothetical protein n=1 Tax=Pseudomonas cichorii TaxID=36746 RepID=UPI0018E638AE|nr:hypothetical protein [Pseudomonas cichorii]MBI6855942.1 hypothetical protein [Pseudomonas cichorii]
MPTPNGSSVPDEVKILCKIGPSSRTILPEIEQWADAVANNVRTSTTGTVTALIWPYRQGMTEYLSVDINGATGSWSLTITTGLPHDFGTSDLQAPDMTEALAMTLVLLSKIRAEVTFFV